MNKINWKQKLSSRKFWALAAGLVTSVISGVASPDTVVQVAGIIGAVGSCAVYILAEASVDGKRENTSEHNEGIDADGYEEDIEG